MKIDIIAGVAIDMTVTKGRHILITGTPGIGKTTLIQKIAWELQIYRPVGFYTREIREAGMRRGFELVSLDGKRYILSHVDIVSQQRVGKYGVDVRGFERFLDCLSVSGSGSSLIVIDEIGKMECFSKKFRDLISSIFGSQALLVATVAARGSGLIADIKERMNVALFEVTRKNRDYLAERISKEVNGRLHSGSYHGLR